MTPNRIKSRTKFVKGTPLKNRAATKSRTRRDLSKNPGEEADPNDKFDTFFDYEEDLAGLKPSSEQYADFESREFKEDSSLVMEEVSPKNIVENEKVNSFNYIIMEDAIPVVMEDFEEIDSNKVEIDANKKDITEDNKKGFVFVRCEFVKKDGVRCKRQAPKNATICSIHKKYKEKMRKVNGSI